VSFSSGFITGQSISRRTGGGGGFGGAALSIATMTQEARSVITGGGGGGAPPEPADPFKTALRDIIDPILEYTFSAGDGTSTGTSVNAGRDLIPTNQTATISADSVGGFDGYFEVAAGNDHLLAGYTDSDIIMDVDRTYIFVFDVDVADVGSRYVNFGNTAGTQNAWGWFFAGAKSPGGLAGVFSSRYLYHSTAAAVNLSAATGTHSGVGLATDCVTTYIDALTPRRTVLFISYDEAANEATIRWKQTLDGSGHTFYTASCSNKPDTAIVWTYFWGYITAGPIGTKLKYGAVVNSNLTAANFDTLADIALGN